MNADITLTIGTESEHLKFSMIARRVMSASVSFDSNQGCMRRHFQLFHDSNTFDSKFSELLQFTSKITRKICGIWQSIEPSINRFPFMVSGFSSALDMQIVVFCCSTSFPYENHLIKSH